MRHRGRSLWLPVSPVQLAEFMGTLLGCPANLVLHPLIERGYVPQNV